MADLICDGSNEVEVAAMIDAINSKADGVTHVFTGTIGAESITLTNSNGGSLFIQPDLTSTVAESLDVISYGIDSGSNTYGNYIKYPDGSMVQYGEVTHDMSSNLYQEHTLPETFVGVWTVSHSVEKGINNSWYDNVHLITTNIDPTIFNLFSSLSRNTVSVSGKLYWTATGRWKA